MPQLLILLLALLLALLPPQCRSADEVSGWVTEPLNAALRFTRLPAQSFNASACPLPPSPTLPVVTARPSQRLQPFLGAGAALTEAAAFNLLALKARNATAYWLLLQRLFASPSQGGTSLLRFPITASDMSLPTPEGGWSFDDADGDLNLTHFNTRMADRYQIPALRDVVDVARRMGNGQMRLLAAPWSVPAWMKTTGLWSNGTLQEDKYPLYARYLYRVVDTFHALNLSFWGITLQSQLSATSPLITRLNACSHSLPSACVRCHRRAADRRADVPVLALLCPQ